MKRLLAALGLAFFFAPAAAFIAGERAEPIENRPLAGLPSLSRGFNAFDDLTQWGVDHMPLRDSAVRLHTRLSREFLGEAPTLGQVAGPVGVGEAPALAGEPAPRADPINGNSVVVGRDGWLFLANEFELACDPRKTPDEVIASVRRLESILVRSGRRLVLAIPPDKGAIEAARVPGDYPLRECAERARSTRSAVLRDARLPGFVDLQAALAAEQRRRGEPVYLKLDTHWTDLGGTVAARSIARAVRPDLTERTRAVRLPARDRVQDLAYLTGDTEPRPEERHKLVRAGVSVKELPFAAGGRRSSARGAPGGAPVFGPDVLLHGDSFAQRTVDQLQPFFADLTFLPAVSQRSDSYATPDLRLVQQIRGSEVLILMKGERGFWSREVHSILDEPFLDRLEKTLLPGVG